MTEQDFNLNTIPPISQDDQLSIDYPPNCHISFNLSNLDIDFGIISFPNLQENNPSSEDLRFQQNNSWISGNLEPTPINSYYTGNHGNILDIVNTMCLNISPLI